MANIGPPPVHTGIGQMYIPRDDAWRKLDGELRARLLEDAIREVARRSFSGALVYFATIFGLLFASHIWRDHALSTSLAMAFTFVFAAGRCLTAGRLLKTKKCDVRCVVILRLSTLVTVAAWGAYCGAMVYHYGHEWPASFLLIAGAALSSGVASSLAPDLLLGVAALLFLILPTCAMALVRGSAGSLLLGAAACCYLAYLCAQLLNNSRAYWKTAVASAFDAMLSRRAAVESEIRFRTLFEDAPSGMYVARRDGRIEMANYALAQMLGYHSPDDLAGSNLRDFTPDHDRNELTSQIDNAGSAIGRESEWTRRDGARIHVRESARSVHVGASRNSVLLGSVEDITVRFAADETRRQLIEILEGTSDFVESVSPAGQTLYLNRAARALSGGASQSLWSRAGDEELRKARLESAAREGIWEGESWLLGPEGKAIPVSQVVIPHHARDGSVRSFSIISRDISAIRAAESALRETQEQLSQSQRLESLGRLAGGIAHDFNNLLTIVMGHASMLLNEIRHGHTRDSLVEIYRGAERAAELTRQLLAFGRRQVLSTGIVDVNEVVRGAERMLRRVIGERIRLVTRLSSAGLTVSADAVQLEQVIINLVLNSRDAMPDGGTATIETSVVCVEDPSAAGASETPPGGQRDYVSIRVSDTGIGMDEETRSRIFEPFFSTKGQGRGTGLGLATVYGFVNQSGGRISVTSSPGQGSTFEILLPRSRNTVSAVSRAEPEPDIRGTERILVVDDEPSLLGLLRQTLAGYGYRVLAASNGEEALQMVAQDDPPDLLVTDVIMPGLTGPQLATRLKALLPDIAVIFISGYPGETEADRNAFGPGASYLPKPFTAEQLLRAVRQRLNHRAAARTAGSAG